MDHQFTLSDYVRPLMRRWWLLAAATLIAMISSFVYMANQPQVYISRATISVGTGLQDPNPNGSEFFLAQQLAETYADMANRAPLRIATLESLELDWLPYYIVSQIPNKPVIEVQVYDENPERAFIVAEEILRQIILQGPAGKEQQNRRDFIEQQLIKIETSITQTEEEVVLRENELLAINSARELANKQAEIQALQNKLSTLQKNYAELLATTQRGAVNVLQVLEPATEPTEPIQSQLVMNMLVAAAVGLALAAGGAYVLEYLDNSLKDAEEIKKALGVTMLATVPKIPEVDGNATNKLIMLRNTQSPVIEAYRILRTNLQFAAVDRTLRLLLVSSPQPEDGKSLTAANLSIALARAGKKVILIDGDLHRPSQHRLFNLYNNIGVTTALLAEAAELDQLLQPTLVPGLSVLTSGPLPPNPAELLGSKRMQEILSKLKELADIVILDSPPIAAVVDGIILSTEADGMLLVIRAGKTSRDAAKRALNALDQVRAPVLGTVLNGVDARNTEYQFYGKYGYYNVAYGRSAVALHNGKAALDPAPSTLPKAGNKGVYETINGHEAHLSNGSATEPDSPATSSYRTGSASTSMHRNAFQTEPPAESPNSPLRPVTSARRRSGLPWK
jgi:polysaccharide biosynthesis transport protein